jgi:hypothetical protein
VSKMPAVPDCDGKRYCRACKAFLPVDKFDKTGPRRYYCAFHMQSLFRRRGIKELAAINLRKRLRRDLVALFGEAVIRMTHAELMHLIAQANKTPSDYHELCMLPCNPEAPITPENVFLATREQRKFLVALYQMTNDVAEYTRGVQRMIANNHVLLSGQSATSLATVPR